MIHSVEKPSYRSGYCCNRKLPHAVNVQDHARDRVIIGRTCGNEDRRLRRCSVRRSANRNRRNCAAQRAGRDIELCQEAGSSVAVVERLVRIGRCREIRAPRVPSDIRVACLIHFQASQKLTTAAGIQGPPEVGGEQQCASRDVQLGEVEWAPLRLNRLK